VTRLALILAAPTGQIEEISKALRSLARRARQEWGCLSFDVYAGVEDHDRIFMQVDWSDPRAMAAYVRSDEFTQVLTIVEMSPARPTFEFHVGGTARGLDYLAEVRGLESADL
jgi:quinol monooxygenase YgiN